MSSANIGQGRVLKVCDLCGGVDDHPRHVVAGAGPNAADVSAAPTQEMADKVMAAAPKADASRLLRDLYDTAVTEHHYDCGRDAGCEFCRVMAENAPGVGRKMLDHAVARRAKFDDPGIVWADTEEN